MPHAGGLIAAEAPRVQPTDAGDGGLDRGVGRVQPRLRAVASATPLLMPVEIDASTPPPTAPTTTMNTIARINAAPALVVLATILRPDHGVRTPTSSSFGVEMLGTFTKSCTMSTPVPVVVEGQACGVERFGVLLTLKPAGTAGDVTVKVVGVAWPHPGSAVVDGVLGGLGVVAEDAIRRWRDSSGC